jgi:hypothetical protein
MWGLKPSNHTLATTIDRGPYMAGLITSIEITSEGNGRLR